MNERVTLVQDKSLNAEATDDLDDKENLKLLDECDDRVERNYEEMAPLPSWMNMIIIFDRVNNAVKRLTEHGLAAR